MSVGSTSPQHSDAIGYLNDLAKEINEFWFNMVCDLVASCGVSVPDHSILEELFVLYSERASYIGIQLAVNVAPVTFSSIQPDFLEQLSGFTNFKLLGQELEVNFKKKITLIFGTNGSGKSSLCASLQVLATSEPPNRPLQNVRATGSATPEFSYKFKSDATQQRWNPHVGYGQRRATIKHFDTAIAISNVKNAVEPGRVIAVTPFKLHIFEWAKAVTTSFRETLKKRQDDNSVKLRQALEKIRRDFKVFEGYPLAAIDENTIANLSAQIKLGEGFTDQKLLSDKQSVSTQLEKATSDEGLKLLRAEHRELKKFSTSLHTLIEKVAELWVSEPTKKMKILADKQTAQAELARTLIPNEGTLDGLLELLRAAAPFCKMEKSEGHVCPLCKRGLGFLEVELFKRYHDLLAGQLEEEIAAIKAEITMACGLATTVVGVDRNEWNDYTTLPVEVITAATIDSDLIVANCEITKEPTTAAKEALESLRTIGEDLNVRLETKKTAIDIADKGRAELLRKLAKLRGEIEPLAYANAIVERLEELKGAQGKADDSKFWSVKLPIFTQVLRMITEKAKEAYEELVVADFEAQLNAEYQVLAEKDMATFGVMLARKGTDGAVTVLPQVGGKEIEGVLSEGEQRLHALSLFFAELESCPESVVVFDDPISSFDYNYISNYCARLRDFSLNHPTKQIILLTHNWEFFVHLQTTMNQAGLDSKLSVQILESGTVVADYSEKIDELKKDIEDVLQAVGEPSQAKRDEMSGKMRRLIEAIVNTHVFNHQRHQYKQKSQQISAFQCFTKIVPLLPGEATTLRDLYAKLSVIEHDDPRNLYTRTDKAMFQSRYNAITAVESAILGRK